MSRTRLLLLQSSYECLGPTRWLDRRCYTTKEDNDLEPKGGKEEEEEEEEAEEEDEEEEEEDEAAREEEEGG